MCMMLLIKEYRNQKILIFVSLSDSKVPFEKFQNSLQAKN